MPNKNHSTIQPFNFSTYKNRKVFVTGHSGFLGSWLVLWLNLLGAEVVGYSLEPEVKPSMYEAVGLNSCCKSVIGNIIDKEKLSKAVKDFQPEIIFHLAAQSLVRPSFANPIETYESNVIGTLNVLEAARKCESVKAFVNVTTDKCYEIQSAKTVYSEDDRMGGDDIYSSSKSCVEIMSESYRKTFLKSGNPFAMATARSGNAIGGGDWAPFRLFSDCVKNINEGKKIEIKNPVAVRPWQYVLEHVYGFLLLGQKLYEDGEKFAQGFNFGPDDSCILPVANVVQNLVKYWGKGEVVLYEPKDLSETKLFALSTEKSEKLLGWKPVFTVDETIKATVDWYKRFYDGEPMLDFSLNQIKNYSKTITE